MKRIYLQEDCFTLPELTKQIIPPDSQAWKLIGRNDIECPIYPANEGFCLGQIIGLIARVYQIAKEEFPTIKFKLDQEEMEVPFWGDHIFLEALEIDDQQRTIRICLGS